MSDIATSLVTTKLALSLAVLLAGWAGGALALRRAASPDSNCPRLEACARSYLNVVESLDTITSLVLERFHGTDNGNVRIAAPSAAATSEDPSFT